MDIKGKCVGVRLEPRRPGDPHICIRLMVEDDENWYPKDFSVSSYWIDDAIKALQDAKAYMEANCDPDVSKLDYHKGKAFGWKFRGNSNVECEYHPGQFHDVAGSCVECERDGYDPEDA